MFNRDHHQPAGEPRRGSDRYVRLLLTVLTAALVLFPYTVSLGESEGSFTLVNRTAHYVHVLINNESYAFVAPGRTVMQEVNAPASVTVEVTYSPGQGIHGKASQSFTVELVTTQSHSNDCSSHSYSHENDCSSNISASTAVLPARWEVTAAELAAGGEEGATR